MIFHGGGLDTAVKKYGGEKSDWLDLSTGINPNPYPVYGVDPLAWHRLPDTKAMDVLTKAARQYYNVDKMHALCVANGTQAIIDVLPRAFSCKRVGIFSPTYNEHAHVWKSSGAEVIEIKRGSSLPDDLDALVIVNPNNPDGWVLEKEELINFAESLNKSNGILIVDEAFFDVVPEQSLVSELPKNAIILKSFGKFFGLAGLRLGFAIGEPLLLSNITQHIGIWSVSGPALQLGARAFSDSNWINYAITALKLLSKKQTEMMQNIGLTIEGENPLFIYASHIHAGKIHDVLAKRQILIRPFLHDETKLRFGICANKEMMERLENALKEAMKEIM